MNTSPLPPVSSRQLPEFRESLSKWASDIMHRRKPSALACDLSNAHAAATSEPLDDRSLYVDLANLRGLSAGTQNLGGYLVGTETTEVVQAFFPVSAVTQAGATLEPQNLTSVSQVMTSSYGSRPSKSLKSKLLERNRHMKTITQFICPLFAALALACFALSPSVQAVSPPPDGGYGGANTAEGTNALFSLTSGVWNVAIGYQSLYHVTTGNQNTATGYQALFNNISGNHSSAYGGEALYSNTTGNDNVAFGLQTLKSNTAGNRNTGMGYRTLAFNTTTNDNTAIGWNALYNNRNAYENTAIGSEALLCNTTGLFNTAIGFSALHNNTSDGANTAVGHNALFVNGGGGGANTAIGANALSRGITGSGNTAIGFWALLTTSGFGNIAVGADAGQFLGTGNFNIDIGNEGINGESNTIRIGDPSSQSATYIAGISGSAVIGDAVVVDGKGQLGTVASAERFKKDIRPMDKTSEAILALKPVSFEYKSDSKGTPQFGLIAEEVAKVNPDLVVRDRKGEIYSVRYDAVNAMLLNEFLKARRQIDAQQKQIDVLTAGLQKVSAQIEASKPAPQVVNNP